MHVVLERMIAEISENSRAHRLAATGSAADVNAKIDSVLSDHEGFAKAFKILQANIDDGTEMAKEEVVPVCETGG